MASINYVTGASGFLGSHLIKRLNNVVSIPHDKLSTIKLEPFDNVYFLSAYGNMFDQTDDGKIIQANLVDLVSIFKQVQNFNFKSFVYISTSSVLLPVQTTYSKSKKMAEDFLSFYIEELHLPVAIVRPFSIVGCGEQLEHLIPKLISSCMHDEEIDFVPESTHDFVDVEDVVRGILYLSKNQKQGIFEIGNGRAYSNQEVLKLVEKCTGYKAKIKIVKSMRPYDSKKWQATKIQWFKKLKPRTLEQTITNMVRVYGN